MLIHVKTFTARKTGSRLVSLECEKCQTPFFYHLTRTGIGKGSAFYFIREEGTKKRAAAAAEKNLLRRLERECELVPCPKCDWVNEELVTRYRKRLYRDATPFIALILVVGMVAAPLVRHTLLDTSRQESQLANLTAFAIVVTSLVAAVLIWLIRNQMRVRFDPNVTHPRRPNLPPGTPPALVEQFDPRTGRGSLVVVPTILDQRRDHNDWAVFRPGQLRFPQICCRCMETAYATYGSPVPVNENSEINVPLCAKCRRRLQLRWWLTVFAVGVVCAVISASFAFTNPRIDQFGRWFLTSIITLFGTLIGGIVIAAQVCRPYRFRVVDRDRGIMKFAAANPQYTALLIDQINQSDGAVVR